MSYSSCDFYSDVCMAAFQHLRAKVAPLNGADDTVEDDADAVVAAMVRAQRERCDLLAALQKVDEAMRVLRPQCTDGADVADVLDSFIPDVRAAIVKAQAP